VDENRTDGTSGYYLLPGGFLAIGIWQLFATDEPMWALATIGLAIVTGVVAYRARRRAQGRE
jgi:hypothetical protein